jgi:Na+/H+ antiporter NhaC
MSSIAISSIVFACVFGGAILGMSIRAILPQHHSSSDSKDVVKLGMGTVATLSALVLGLLIASAKGSYDAQSTELTQMSAKVILLDRILAHYGPETKETRDLLRGSVARILDQMWSKRHTSTSPLEAPSGGAEILLDKIQELTPKDDRQRSLQSQALSIVLDLGQTRWLQYSQVATSVSMPLLVVLVFWLTTIFISFGLFAPANVTVFSGLLVSALSVTAAILLILELYTPYSGLIQISSAPLRDALTQLGR